MPNNSIDIEQHQPSQLLKRYVRKISVFKSKDRLLYKQKLTPTAYIYLTYHHEDIPVNIIGDKKIVPDFRLQIDGPKIYKNSVVEYDGKLHRVMVEFTASGFYYLFHYSPSECIDQLCPLDNFFDDSRVEILEKELSSLQNPNEQIKSIEKFLIELSYRALPFNDYVEEALQIINDHHGSISISNVIKKVRVSERQFSRQFSKIVGVSPKHYSKIIQLHYIIKLMNLKKYTSLQDIAYSAELYDLPHFTHMFKELTGFAPLEFIHSDKHIALKYFGDLI